MIPSTVSDYSVFGVNAITLALDVDLLYYITGVELVSYNLGEGGDTDSFPHESGTFPMNSPSLAAYNDYLAFPITTAPFVTFAKIRDLDIGGRADLTLIAADSGINQVYMIREELQPIPGIGYIVGRDVLSTYYCYSTTWSSGRGEISC